MLAKLTKVELVKEIRFLRSQLAVQHHRIDNLEQVKAHAYKEASRLSDALLCVSDRIDTARGSLRDELLLQELMPSLQEIRSVRDRVYQVYQASCKLGGSDNLRQILDRLIDAADNALAAIVKETT